MVVTVETESNVWCDDGFQQCYNAQLVMDADSQLIVAAAVSPGQRPGPVAGVAGCLAG